MGWNTTYPSSPIFVADWNSIDRNTGRQVDWSLVPDSYRAGVAYTITTSGAIATATAVPVTALPVALPVGATLNFTGAGKLAVLTAPAAVGATSLTVEPLPQALIAADTAPWLVSQSNHKVVPAGTAMCQIVASGKIVPRLNAPAAEPAIGLLETNAQENSKTDSLSGYGVIVGGVIYENLLPASVAAYKTELETNGMSWVWATYADSSEV